LIILFGKSVGKTFTIKTDAVIGRAVDATIHLSSDDVSRQHARIWQQFKGTFFIEDLGSRNER